MTFSAADRALVGSSASAIVYSLKLKEHNLGVGFSGGTGCPSNTQREYSRVWWIRDSRFHPIGKAIRRIKNRACFLPSVSGRRRGQDDPRPGGPVCSQRSCLHVKTRFLPATYFEFFVQASDRQIPQVTPNRSPGDFERRSSINRPKRGGHSTRR